MKNMTLQNIAHSCGGEIVNAPENDREISGAVIDSRLVEKDFLFFATKGAKVDGHDFINDVFKKGALAVVCERVPEGVTGPCILVKDSFEALKSVAAFYRNQLDIKVVGITGSVGKTSTKEFIASVLSKKFNVLKTDKNFNNEVGLPLTVLKIRDEHEVAVLEMGISDFGEMTRLSAIARPDIGVITNIGDCHLENLGTRAGVMKAKTEMFTNLAENAEVCLFGDDENLVTITEVNGKKPVFFGLGENNEVYAKNVENKGLLGSEAEICYGDYSFKVKIPLPGKHMVLNALAATAVGNILGLSCDEIKKGIEKCESLAGRSNIVSVKGLTVIDDCYNANPVSVKAAVDLLCEADTRKVAILGDMFELGDREKDFHKEVGEYVDLSDTDVLVCIGDLSKNTYEGASKSGKTECYYYENKDNFMEKAGLILKDGDSVLIKASHGMEFEKLLSFMNSEEFSYQKMSEEDIYAIAARKDAESDKKLFMGLGIGAAVLVVAIIAVIIGLNISKEKKLTQGILFYPDDTGIWVASGSEADTDGKRLYYKNSESDFVSVKPNGKDEKIIAENITDFATGSKNELFFATDGILYKSDENGENMERIVDDCLEFELNESKDAVRTLSENGKLQVITLGKETEVYDLADNVTSVLEASEDFKYIFAETPAGIISAGCDGLGEMPVDTEEPIKTYSYFSGKNAEMYYLNDNNELFWFNRNRNENIRVSEYVKDIFPTEETEKFLLVKYTDDLESSLKFAKNGKLKKISSGSGITVLSNVVNDTRKNRLLFVGENVGEYKLYELKYGMFSKHMPTVIEMDVNDIELLKDKDIYTTKPGEDGTFDLYNGSLLIAENVCPGSVAETLDGKGIVFAYKTNASGDAVVIAVYNGEEIVTAGVGEPEPVTAVSCEEIFFLQNNGDTTNLMEFYGNKLKTVEEDVEEYKYLRY